jgi:hypothetical protein
MTGMDALLSMKGAFGSDSSSGATLSLARCMWTTADDCCTVSSLYCFQALLEIEVSASEGMSWLGEKLWDMHLRFILEHLSILCML